MKRTIIFVSHNPDGYCAYCPEDHDDRAIPMGAIGSGQTIAEALRSLSDAIDLMEELASDTHKLEI